MNTFQVIAHRGASAYVHENTLAAFEKAIEMKADMIELDVHKTADNVLAVFHDALIGGKALSTLTYKQLNEAANVQGFSIPTLADACAVAAGKIRVNIEIKTALGCEKPVIETALRFLPKEDVMISSVFLPVLENCADMNSGIPLGLVIFEDEKRASFLTWCAPKRPYDRMIDFLSVPYVVLCENGTLSVPSSTKPMYIWTVNDGEIIRKLAQQDNVRGVFTDIPDVARAALDR
ncbi:glycerophosphodiester phosphodiesterase [bacterium]|nr:glycerophosphodiester phosphodiesterase [bacterium]